MILLRFIRLQWVQKHLLGPTVDWIRSRIHGRAGVLATVAGRVSHQDDARMQPDARLEAHCLFLGARAAVPKLVSY